jgi:tungstate transport system ATP-binding protein
MSLLLKVFDLWKEYNGSPVLQGASFSFDGNGIYVLMGDNGTGKSTFLRICALLERYDRGEVNYISNGQLLPHDIELRRRITLVLPKIGIFNTTVFNNVAYGLKIRGLEGKAIKDSVNSAIDFVGLGHKKKQAALTLSSGETQRLGIARALVINPQMLFLDEPAAFVDVRNREIIEGIILRLKNERKSTVILTTHDMLQAERLADRLLILAQGRITAP